MSPAWVAPVHGQEEWKYTDPSVFLRDRAEQSPDHRPDPGFLPGGDVQAVFRSGRLDREASRLDGKVRVRAFSDLSASELDSLELDQGLPATGSLHRFVQERFGDGLLVQVPRGVDGGRIQWFEMAGDNSCLRHLVVLEPGARLEIVRTLRGGPQDSVERSLVQFRLGANASLSQVLVAEGSAPLRAWNGTVARLERDARFRHRQFLFSTELVRSELHVDLAGQGAEADLGGLASLRRDQAADLHCLVRHSSPSASSNQMFQALAADRASSSFLGIVQVDRHAQKTAARQQSRNLLLSREASINSRPQLEIWADDVKCSHGSTTGRLDEKAMFFLRSRGFSPEGARALLVRAFAGEQIEAIEDEVLREWLHRLLEESL